MTRPSTSGRHRVFLALGLLIVLLAPCTLCVILLRELAQISECESKMQQLALAFLNFESATGRYPYPATVNGTLSWRVLVPAYVCAPLPPVNLNAAWNSPINLPCHSQCPWLLTSHDWHTDQSQSTHIVAIKAPDSIWQSKRVTRRDVSDQLCDTLIFMELAIDRINWMSPVDIELEELEGILRRDGRLPSPHRSGVLMAFADGSVKMIPHERITPGLLRAFVSIRGGERIPIRLEATSSHFAPWQHL